MPCAFADIVSSIGQVGFAQTFLSPVSDYFALC